jgi:asparagine synthase (glutamine-hydrolysing)
MCGIFCYIGNKYDYNIITQQFFKTRYRGPDNSVMQKLNNNLYFGFHRLCINDVSNYANQPLNNPYDNNVILICNGEIYNYNDLKMKYKLVTKSTSDCEIILHLYKLFGFKKTVNMLDGVFSLVLFDNNENKIYAARDPFGVRGMFVGYKNDEILISSEMKSISNLVDNIIPFPPGHIWCNNDPQHFERYYHIPILDIENKENIVLVKIKELFTNAVNKRLMSDRPIAALLSGGLDSSLVCALLSKKVKNLKTFSIGLKGSVDLKYAKIVAEHIKSDHYSIELSEEVFLNNIEEVIRIIESYDTTTVRASVGNYLVSKYISENTECKVIYCGDGSDEQSGYRYLQNAPNKQEFQDECFKLLNEIYLYDALRSDRTISSNGLEARVPFLDKDFVSYYMSIEPKMKMYSSDKIEKKLLRQAFDNENLLPKEILWRSKCAFSDGVSGKERSWHKIIQDFLKDKVSDHEFEFESKKYKHNSPKTKEELYYRRIFEKYYENKSNVIPHFWMPKWCGNIIDPSARELSINQEN